MRILGLDYGERTIGVAVSDALLLTANPITVIRRKENESIKNSITVLAQLVDSYEIEKIVLGYPKNMDNTVGERAQKTEKFGKKLEKELKLPVILWDERLSSVSVEKAMLAADLSRKKRRENIDKAAAALILQNYLDFERNRKIKEKGEKNMANDNEILFSDDETEEFDVIVLVDEETGEDIELVVVDSADAEGCTYLLVIASDDFDDEEPPASIIKEIKDDNDEFIYEIVEDEEEFNKASELFKGSDDFDIV